MSGNSAAGWVRAELCLGYLSIAQFVEASWWLARYHLGDAKLEDAILRSVQTLRGSYESDLVHRCDRFNRDWVQPRIRPGAFAVVETHRKAGDHLCLLTSASDYVAAPLARSLEIEGVICNRFLTDEDGRFTGEAAQPLSFGPGKLALAQAYAERAGLSLDNAVFYTDSYSDLPVLEAVGGPVVVHPDPRLAQLAARRRWNSVFWGE